MTDFDCSMDSKEELSDLHAEEQELKDIIKSTQAKLSELQEKIVQLEIEKAIDGVERSFDQARIIALLRANKWFSTRVKKIDNKIRINDDIFCVEAEEHFGKLKNALYLEGYTLVRGSTFTGDKEDDTVYWVY